MGMLSKSFYRLLRDATELTQGNYPETLGMLLIVNVPFFFAGIWATIKGWLDEKTRSKVELISAAQAKTKLLEVIDEDQLVEFLGGSNTANLRDSIGPWNNYEIMDSAMPGATIGVRHLSSGETFTPQDLAKLPNPLVLAEL